MRWEDFQVHHLIEVIMIEKFQSFAFPVHEGLGKILVCEGRREAGKCDANLIKSRNIEFVFRKGKVIKNKKGHEWFEAEQLLRIDEHKPNYGNKKRVTILMDDWDINYGPIFLEIGYDLVVLTRRENFTETKKVIATAFAQKSLEKTREAFCEGVRRFRVGKSQKAFYESIKIDTQTGISPWIEAEDILATAEREGILGNGNTVNRTGTVWRDYLVIHTRYNNGTERLDIPGIGAFYRDIDLQPKRHGGGSPLSSLRFVGYAPLSPRKLHIPTHIKTALLDTNTVPRSVISGSRTEPEIDHKEGRPQRFGFSDGTKTTDYQILTQSENKIKRNRCTRCRETGKRCNATTERGLPIAFTQGGSDFNVQKEGCKGCILYDVAGFYSEMTDMLVAGVKPYTETPYLEQDGDTIPTIIWPETDGWVEQMERLAITWML
jgi:ICEA Protein